jgi:hypothetical protein
MSEARAIGERMRDARQRLGLTQADVGAGLGYTQGWVSKAAEPPTCMEAAGRGRVGRS